MEIEFTSYVVTVALYHITKSVESFRFLYQIVSSCVCVRVCMRARVRACVCMCVLCVFVCKNISTDISVRRAVSTINLFHQPLTDIHTM